MAALREILQYTNDLLEIDRFKDYAPNGLQVEGGSDIKSIVSGVTASLELVTAAVEAGADALLVHHGYFWKGEDPCVSGMKKRRLQALLKHEISLIAYHLPLDAHPVYGNNALLGALLGIEFKGVFGSSSPPLVMEGEFPAALSAAEVSELLAEKLGRNPLHISGGETLIKTIAWCSGGAQNYIEEAAVHGVDAYISGEISEKTTHIAREMGVHYFAAGHHATERYGIESLSMHLSRQFNLSHQFIDIDNPV
ncbi:MAG: Nif3-like dinuclear metal center hexameric protein [Gammaproteobacteria bacterium]|nr:Nif3-like dinuclear metal center hexameric protein [Gammaproteobacteria bacterium]